MEKDAGCDDGDDGGGGEREGNEKWKENLLRFLISYPGFKLSVKCRAIKRDGSQTAKVGFLETAANTKPTVPGASWGVAELYLGLVSCGF